MGDWEENYKEMIDREARDKYVDKMRDEWEEVKKYAAQMKPQPYYPNYPMPSVPTPQFDTEACVQKIENSVAELGEQFKRLVDLIQKLMEYQIVIPTEEIKKELAKEVKKDGVESV